MMSSEDAKTHMPTGRKQIRDITDDYPNLASVVDHAVESRPNKIAKTIKAGHFSGPATRINGNSRECASFHRFFNLPLELRDHVYKSLVPDCITQCKKGEGDTLISMVPLLGVSHQVRREVKELMFIYTEFEYVVIDPVLKPVTNDGTTSNSKPNMGPLSGTCNTGHLLPLPHKNEAEKLLSRISKLKVTLNLTVEYKLETIFLMHDRFRYFISLVYRNRPLSLHTFIQTSAETRHQAIQSDEARWHWPWAMVLRPQEHGSFRFTLACQGVEQSRCLPTSFNTPSKIDLSTEESVWLEPYLLWKAWRSFRNLKEHIGPQLRGAEEIRLNGLWDKAIQARQALQYAELMGVIGNTLDIIIRERFSGRLMDKKTLQRGKDAFRAKKLALEMHSDWPKPKQP